MSNPTKPIPAAVEAVFDALLEMFAPAIDAELLEVLDLNSLHQTKFVHLRGTHLLKTAESQQALSKTEKLRVMTGSGVSPDVEPAWQLSLISPGDLLKTAAGFAPYIMVGVGQLDKKMKAIGLEHEARRFSVIMDARCLGHEHTHEMFMEFWSCAKTSIEKGTNIADEFILRRLPATHRDGFLKTLGIVSKISMARIENKPIECGFVLVRDYGAFKRKYAAETITELESPSDLRLLLQKPQPLLEVCNGQQGFVVVEPSLSVPALFYPLKTPLGVDPLMTGGKDVAADALIIRVRGTRLIRVIANNEIALELHSGRVRVKDYSALVAAVRQAASRFQWLKSPRKLVNVLLELSEKGKGTIIVFGLDSITGDFKGGTPCRLPLVRNGKLRADTLVQLSSTDGALLVDSVGNALLFGAILGNDGIEKVEDAAGCGSRSYAASAFAARHPECLVVKISEDGPISLYYGEQGRLDV